VISRASRATLMIQLIYVAQLMYVGTWQIKGIAVRGTREISTAPSAQTTDHTGHQYSAQLLHIRSGCEMGAAYISSTVRCRSSTGTLAGRSAEAAGWHDRETNLLRTDPLGIRVTACKERLVLVDIFNWTTVSDFAPLQRVGKAHRSYSSSARSTLVGPYPPCW
jgi:hypothetical protein